MSQSYTGHQKCAYDPSQGIAELVSEFSEIVTEALRETDASEEIVAGVEEKGTELTQAVESQSGGVQELRRENQQLRSELSDYRESNEFDKASMKERISSVEGGSSDSNPGENGGETTLHRPETPLESVVSLPEHMVESELTSNQERARFLAMDVADYATKVPAGWSLDYSTIKKIVKAKEESTPHGQTVIRVMNFLDRLGKDGTKDVDRRGKRRIIFTKDAVQRLERLSQAGTPAEDGATHGVVTGAR